MQTTLKQQTWQLTLQQAITQVEELYQLLELDNTMLATAKLAQQDFHLRVPKTFLECIEKGNPRDPLLLQVLPQGMELQQQPGYSCDPLDETAVNPVPGLLHKYHGRVLLTLVANCGINCRYCFRRHFPYTENTSNSKNWDKIYDYIAANQTIHEVILSGGDPLLAPDELLAKQITALATISHVKTLRIHSRLPIVIPERLTKTLLDIFNSTRLQTVLVTHCNHPNELTSKLADSLVAYQRENIHLLNQTVLLKDINDNADVLINLSKKLFSYGIMPYYLHLLDKVAGSAHFEVELDKAMQIYQQILKNLPGYLVPKLVQELPTLGYKQILTV